MLVYKYIYKEKINYVNNIKGGIMRKIFGYKKVLICTAAILLTACSSDASYKDLEKNAENVAKHVSDQIENQKDADNENVLGVKNGYPENYPDCKYGDVFEEFFADPTWQYFKSTEDRDIVEFTGYCTYMEQEVKARLQFVLNNDDTFEASALSFNDVPQSKLITVTLITKAFSDYMKNHNMEDDAAAIEAEIDSIFGNYDIPTTTPETTAPQVNNTVPPATVVYETEDDEELYNIKADGYYDIFPDSNARYLDYADVEDMDAYTVRLGLNEIYARHGRKFNDANLQEYFNSQPWYTPVYTPDEFNAIENSVFNAYEKANVKFLADLIR